MNPLLRALYGGAGAVAKLLVATGLPGEGKFARSVNARRGLRARYDAFAAQGRDRARPLIWFHAPSVGEGLQAAPVMKRLRETRPDIQQAYTLFSPSAAPFAARIGADFHDFLPFDRATDMRAALEALRPDALVFSKLDVWPVLVAEAARRRVPVGMISATLAADSGRRGGLSAAVTRDAYATLSAPARRGDPGHRRHPLRSGLGARGDDGHQRPVAVTLPRRQRPSDAGGRLDMAE
jgi:3-deoxy-D-manno-octulosonic-acid transferase